MLSILLLVFAGMSVLGTLVIAASNMSGGKRAWIVAYNTAMIVIMVLSAIQLMN